MTLNERTLFTELVCQMCDFFVQKQCPFSGNEESCPIVKHESRFCVSDDKRSGKRQ